METTSVHCDNCTAPLEVAAGADYATCRYCGSRQAIEWTASAAAADLPELDELEQLDREWEEERKLYLPQDRRGRVYEPTALDVFAEIGLWIFGGLIMGFGAGFVLDGPGRKPPCLAAVIWAAGFAIGCAIGFLRMINHDLYVRAKIRYERRRAALTEALKPKPDHDRPPGEIVF